MKVETPELFFIAVIPPPEICASIMVFKQDMQVRFGSRAAMKIIPHITLKAPFKLPASEVAALRMWFGRLKLPRSPFPVRLNGFGAFPKAHSPVLYVKPEFSPELAQWQQSVLVQFRAQYPHIPLADTENDFHPHITVAYRDLTPDMFRLAWAEYEHKAFEAAFFAGSAHLLHHDGKQWMVFQTIDFQ